MADVEVGAELYMMGSWPAGWSPSGDWAQIEESGLTGLDLLDAIVDALGPLPVRAEVEVLAGEAGFGCLGRLAVTYWVPDAYDPVEVRKQRFMMSIPERPFGEAPEPTALQWARWLMWALAFVAVHEVAEFFVVGGVRLFDPHAAGARPVLDVPPHPVQLRV